MPVETIHTLPGTKNIRGETAGHNGSINFAICMYSKWFLCDHNLLYVCASVYTIMVKPNYSEHIEVFVLENLTFISERNPVHTSYFFVFIILSPVFLLVIYFDWLSRSFGEICSTFLNKFYPTANSIVFYIFTLDSSEL